jgi:hypothetical protein
VLSIERVAGVQARLDAGRDRGELLAAEGLSEPQWASALRQCLQELGRQSARGRHEPAQQYQRAYLAARPDLTAPTKAATAPVIATVASLGAAPSAPEQAAAETGAAGDVDGTAFALHLDLGSVLPFQAPASGEAGQGGEAAMGGATAAAKAPAGGEAAGETQALSVEHRFGPALPFEPGGEDG